MCKFVIIRWAFFHYYSGSNALQPYKSDFWLNATLTLADATQLLHWYFTLPYTRISLLFLHSIFYSNPQELLVYRDGFISYIMYSCHLIDTNIRQLDPWSHDCALHWKETCAPRRHAHRRSRACEIENHVAYYSSRFQMKSSLSQVCGCGRNWST